LILTQIATFHQLSEHHCSRFEAECASLRLEFKDFTPHLRFSERLCTLCRDPSNLKLTRSDCNSSSMQNRLTMNTSSSMAALAMAGATLQALGVAQSLDRAINFLVGVQDRHHRSR
jgi:hypothetical protein